MSVKRDTSKPVEKTSVQKWHCNGPCNEDKPHKVFYVDEDGIKTVCLDCERETLR